MATSMDFFRTDSGTEQSCWGPEVGDTSQNLGASASGAHAGEKTEGSARFRWLLRRPDSVPWGGWELAPGEGELGVALPAAGLFLSTSLQGASGQPAALPSPALLLALWVLFRGTACPEGSERASTHQHWGESGAMSLPVVHGAG